jgi:ribosomal protein L7/L12
MEFEELCKAFEQEEQMKTKHLQAVPNCRKGTGKNIHKERTLKIAEMLKERDLEWRIFLRTDIITLKGGFEYLKKLHDCGLKEVCVGVESADNYIKSNIYKGTTIEQDTKVLKW